MICIKVLPDFFRPFFFLDVLSSLRYRLTLKRIYWHTQTYQCMYTNLYTYTYVYVCMHIPTHRYHFQKMKLC